jgi:hypothetical protein
MHLLRTCRSAVLCFAAALASQAFASPILYYTPTTLSTGLGKAGSSQFTNAVTSAFGAGNVIEIPTFGNVADFDDGAALFVNARGQSDVLSAAERTNLLNFINAGGAVFFVGDHASWTGWDNSFLNLFGDSFTHWNNAVGAAHVTNNAPGQFTPGDKVLLSAPGAITGGHGKKLFTLFPGGGGPTMASLYGPDDNAIVNAFSNSFTNNLGFFNDVGSWLFETASAYELSKQPVVTPPSGNPVPEAMSVLAIAPVLFALAWFRRRVRL